MQIAQKAFRQAKQKPQGNLCGFTRIFAKHGGKDASERRSDGWDDAENKSV